MCVRSVNNYEVCDLLAGDGFSQVGDSSGAFAGSSGFQIGDVAVYYGGDPGDTSGNPAHSVKIIGFNPDGSPICRRSWRIRYGDMNWHYLWFVAEL